MFTLEKGEEVIRIVRRHYFVVLPMILTLILGSILPLVLYKSVVSGLLPFDERVVESLKDFVAQWAFFAYSIWVLFLWMVFFVEWTDYYLDIWVLTNKRIIDVEQKGFFHREVTSFVYDQIQDITVETKGFIETFFKIGTLHIQTAGHNREIVIRDAHHPEEARGLILRLGRGAM